MSATTTVTTKCQVTIPAPLRKKYRIREGTKIQVTDTPSGLLFKPIPDMNDWAGADAGKYTYEEMTRKLDRLRARWR
ncbi:MAG TPA: AbrB/MazE/SpoVT family DNA-binding domain-containing protein [Candidatus Dormibacteraeota bacterium]|nr:AbrB/MazE/SpoVT family DNA-binding domain-containing protein [Candidatus Dormibacteraeota bacterium]